MSVQNHSFLSAVKKSWLIGLVALFTAIVFSGCGGGGNNGSNNKEQTTTLNGQVVDDPISDATVTILDIDSGKDLAHCKTDNKGKYSVKVPANDKGYKINVNGGYINGVEFTGKMEAICSSQSQECDITPFSTLVNYMSAYFTLFFHPFHSKPSTFLSPKQAYRIVA